MEDVVQKGQKCPFEKRPQKDMYKLVAIDLDGTMLNRYGAVTEYARDVLKKANQNGTSIIIASR